MVVRVSGFAPTAQDPNGMSGLIVIDPEKGSWRMVVESGWFGSLPPDGKSLAFFERTREKSEIWIYDIAGNLPQKRIADIGGVPVWSPDGKQIVFTAVRDPIAGGYETWRMNADGSNRTKLPLTEIEQVADWSPDGAWLAVNTIEREVRPLKFNIARVHPDGTDRKALTEGEGQRSEPRFSPDGRRIVFRERTDEGKQIRTTLWTMDSDGQNRRQIPLEGNLTLELAVWSPDGQRLGLGVFDSADDNPDRIQIVDADGKNPQRVRLPSGRTYLVDWR